MDIFLQLALSGLLLGGIYGLLSLGLTLVFGVTRIANFAHGEFVMLGMYISYFLWQEGFDPYLATPIVFLVCFFVGIVIQHFVLRRTLTMPHLVQVFVTLGISVVMQSAAQLLFTSDFYFVRPSYGTAMVELGTTRLPLTTVIAATLAFVGTALVHVFLKKTNIGAAIRATAQDPYAANVVGIETKRVYAVTFGLGIGCAGLAGSLLAPIYPVYPTVGLAYSLISFVVVVLGGLGSLPGALIGGLIVGLLETFSAYYISPEAKEATYFIIFIIVLLLRPAGLLGLRGSETMGTNH